MLINLGDDLPAGFERYRPVIEIVGRSDPGAPGRPRALPCLPGGLRLRAHDLAQRSGE